MEITSSVSIVRQLEECECSVSSGSDCYSLRLANMLCRHESARYHSHPGGDISASVSEPSSAIGWMLSIAHLPGIY